MLSITPSSGFLRSRVHTHTENELFRAVMIGLAVISACVILAVLVPQDWLQPIEFTGLE
jgi:hypothetical protein